VAVVGSLARDLRYTLRSLRGTLRLTFAALGCVALGLGGAVFILTVANAVLLQAPPFPDADRLMRVWTLRGSARERADVSYLDARDVTARARSFDAVEIIARTRAAFTMADGTERVRGESVTPGYFDLIAMRPSLGRLFARDEYAPDAPRVIIIGHALWMRAFGGRPDVLGQTVRARPNDGAPDESEQLFSIVGVMPPGFSGTVDPDVSEFWLPLEQYAPRAHFERRRSRPMWVLARLRPGVTPAAAHAEVSAIGRQLAAQHPDDYHEISLAVEPVGETWRERFRSGLTMLTAAAGLLLLIACVNIAYLLLARLAQRDHELRLRAALGAPRGSLVRQLLLESLILTLGGGAAGMLLAVGGVKIFAAAQVFRLPSFLPLSVDVRVMVLGLGLVLVTALVSGALPALFVARTGASQQLREIGRGTTLGRRQRVVIDGLVAAEIALSSLLLVGSTLMVRTYANLVGSDLGFRTENIQRMAVTLDRREFPTPASQLAFVREAKSTLEALPGVAGVAFVAGVLPPWIDGVAPIAVGGVPRPELAADRHAVDDDFFGTMGIPVSEGRAFHAGDQADSRRVAVVSQSLARAIAGDARRSAVGTTIQIARDARQAAAADEIVIVGVVADVRYHGPNAARRADHDLYVPIAQRPDETVSIAIHARRDPTLLMGAVRRAIGRLAPTSPVHWVSTMEEELGIQFGDARLYAWLTAVFGASALLLVTIGVYGVVSNSVTRRWSELGVRMAIGARPTQIVTLVLAQAARPMLIGVAAGAAVSLAAASLLSTLVYGVATSDAVTFIGVGMALLAIALGACYLPARRVTRLELRDVLLPR
jgi:putative ABC transport system permease protein